MLDDMGKTLVEVGAGEWDDGVIFFPGIRFLRFPGWIFTSCFPFHFTFCPFFPLYVLHTSPCARSWTLFLVARALFLHQSPSLSCMFHRSDFLPLSISLRPLTYSRSAPSCVGSSHISSFLPPPVGLPSLWQLSFLHLLPPLTSPPLPILSLSPLSPLSPSIFYLTLNVLSLLSFSSAFALLHSTLPSHHGHEHIEQFPSLSRLFTFFSAPA